MADHFAVFVLGLLAVFAVSLFTLYSYSNIRKQHVIVTVATLIAWYSSFIIVFILPLDISAVSTFILLHCLYKYRVTYNELYHFFSMQIFSIYCLRDKM